MEYIINPWWFYLVSVLNTLHFMAVIGAGLSIIACGVAYAFYCDHVHDYVPDNGYTTKVINTVKKLCIVFFLCVTLIIIVPTDATMNKMMIANVLTTENIKNGTDFTQDQIGKLVDKIADAAIRVKEADGRR